LSVMYKHLKAPLEPPDHLNPELSTGCAQVIEMMMAKSPLDRYRSAKDLLEDLDLILQNKPPHFAHRSLDHLSVSKTLTDMVQTAPAAAPVPRLDAGRRSLMQEPSFLVVLALLLISALCNLIQALI